jgi:hypothetical protein
MSKAFPNPASQLGSPGSNYSGTGGISKAQVHATMPGVKPSTVASAAGGMQKSAYIEQIKYTAFIDELNKIAEAVPGEVDEGSLHGDAGGEESTLTDTLPSMTPTGQNPRLQPKYKTARVVR